MENETVFIPREGGVPKGKDWDTFMTLQQETLAQRSRDGWELVTALGVLMADSLREASKTAGVLLYFRKN